MTNRPPAQRTAGGAQAVPATDDPTEVTRRALIAGTIGACAVLALGGGQVLLAEDAQAANGIKRLPDGRVKVTPAKIPGLARVGGVVNLGTVKGRPVALVRTGQSAYRALNLQCTHQGVTVARSGSGWECPAHGSRFAVGGKVTGGPAAVDLNRVTVARSGASLIVG